MEFIEFPPVAEFTDRYGKTRPIATCSVLGREEFWERLQQIQGRLSRCTQAEGWQDLYDRDERLRFLVDRCLILNGIDPDWVTLSQVESLLFHRMNEEKGEPEHGWLIELNRTKQSSQNKSDEPPLTTEETIALIALANGGSIKEAIDAATSIPAVRLMPIVQAKADLQDPKHAEKKKKKVMKEKHVGDLERLLSIPVDDLPEVRL